jgi:hypothetical protein
VEGAARSSRSSSMTSIEHNHEIETRYTIDHPYGSIIARSIVNAEVGYV